MIAGQAIAGVGFGSAFTAALQLLIPQVAPGGRAAVVAAVYVVAYTAFGVPIVVEGQLVAPLGEIPAVVGYTVLTILLALVSLVARTRLARRGRTPVLDHRERKPMSRIFLAGASGVIGRRLVPFLVEAGHTVAGMTRSASKADQIADLGAEPAVVDVFDREALIAAVVDFRPDVILNELTDLPDDVNQIAAYGDLNARIRTEGNQNVIEAARAAGSPRILVQSVAWELPDGPDSVAVKQLESSVLAESGVVLSYGQFYGPGTYNEHGLPAEPRVHIDRAAARTVEVLDAPSGVVTIVD
ncbi:NAD-dependent epimerase/dehydratase family protein [Pseudonocardia benzenivorans]